MVRPTDHEVVRRPWATAVLALLALVAVAALAGARTVEATVYMTSRKNRTMWEHEFSDAPAAFGPRVQSQGLYGSLVKTDPLDACSPLKMNASSLPDIWFAVIERSVDLCPFDKKVLMAQEAGASAAIIFNNIPGGGLLVMGSEYGFEIHVPSVFVTYSSGMQMLEAIENITTPGGPSARIMPDAGETAWNVLAVCFIAIVVVTCVLATFYFVRRGRPSGRTPEDLFQQRQRGERRATPAQVKGLKAIKFKSTTHLPLEADSCSICLDEYEAGDRVKILRCNHAFHMKCVDKWLTTRRAVCPMCKGDPFSTEPLEDAATESTPLLGGGSGGGGSSSGAAASGEMADVGGGNDSDSVVDVDVDGSDGDDSSDGDASIAEAATAEAEDDWSREAGARGDERRARESEERPEAASEDEADVAVDAVTIEVDADA